MTSKTPLERLREQTHVHVNNFLEGSIGGPPSDQQIKNEYRKIRLELSELEFNSGAPRDLCTCGLALCEHTEENLSTPAPHSCVGFKSAHQSFERTEIFVRAMEDALEAYRMTINERRVRSGEIETDECRSLRKDVSRISRKYFDLLEEKNKLKKKLYDLTEAIEVFAGKARAAEIPAKDPTTDG
jgi:polyhydroxyalkanoate synthesis regulator phasin